MQRINEITDFIAVLVIMLIIFAVIFHSAWVIFLCAYAVIYLIHIWAMFKIFAAVYTDLVKDKLKKPIVPHKFAVIITAVMGLFFLYIAARYIWPFVGLFYICSAVSVFFAVIICIEDKDKNQI